MNIMLSAGNIFLGPLLWATGGVISVSNGRTVLKTLEAGQVVWTEKLGVVNGVV